MAQDSRSGGSERRGDLRYVLALFVGLTVAGTALQLAVGGAPLPRAVLVALVLALPFSAYAWYEGWGR